MLARLLHPGRITIDIMGGGLDHARPGRPGDSIYRFVNGSFIMRVPRAMIAMFLVLCVAGLPAASGFQTDTPETPKPTEGQDVQALTTGQPAPMATIDRIMEQAVRNIALRYNLNETQTKITSALMLERVYEFLEEHEAEVWPVIRDLLKSQLRPPEDEKDRRKVGKSGGPLLEAVSEAIFQANQEWRLILTEEQQKVHDFDLDEMEKTFTKMGLDLDQWAQGKSTEGGLFPSQNLQGQPPQPSMPEVKVPPPAEESFGINMFDATVEHFIKENGLSEGQITSARAILTEHKGKANDFRASKRVELAKVDHERETAYAHADLDGVKEAHLARKKLLKPVFELHSQMTDRLDGLLTSIQIQRRDELKLAKAEQRKTSASKKSKVTRKTNSDKDVKPASPKEKPDSDSDSDSGQ